MQAATIKNCLVYLYFLFLLIYLDQVYLLLINEKNLSKNLQTKNIPDPDLLIRTGNTKRLSNFLLWQIAYSEIFFEKKLWPAFNERDYKKIIKEFKSIKRNFGKI